jgi:hypothetical protein
MPGISPESDRTWLAAITDKALVVASNANIFARGKTYAHAGVIDVIGEDPPPAPALRAQIRGTEMYMTEVRIENDAITGNCDCPSAAEGWFCKHQVALALFWRERLDGKTPDIDETAHKKIAASTKRAQTVKDKRERLHAFLHSQDAHTLADKLIDLANNDPRLERQLLHWQKLNTRRDDPAELKTLITELFATNTFIDYYAAHDYARQAEAVLPLLEQACQRDPTTGIPLTVHALRRCWRALENADDSNGEIGGVCESIGATFIAALQAAGPQPERFGKTYFDLLIDDPFGSFDKRAAEAAIGAKALAHFRNLLAGQWRSVKDTVLAQRTQGKKRNRYFINSGDSEFALDRLERLHIDQLVATGDIDAAITVLSEDLSDASAHNSLLYFLEKHARHREAFSAAERANKAFPGNHLLEGRLLDCYRRDGWHCEALALLRAQFERTPNLSTYRQVLAAARDAKKNPTLLRQELLDFLQAREQAILNDPRNTRYKNPGGQTGPLVSLRAEILCAESLWLDALALVQPPALCDGTVLQRLALHLPATHGTEAVTLLRRVFSTVMPQSSSPYREALQLVEQIATRMTVEARQAWLASLRSEYKAKRNFVRDLPKE